jgi:hypothetical protein
MFDGCASECAHPRLRQVVQRLGINLPVLIEGEEHWETPADELDSIFLGDAELWCVWF